MNSLKTEQNYIRFKIFVKISTHKIMNWDILLAAIIPSAIVFVTAFLLLRDFLKKHERILKEFQENEQKKVMAQIKTENKKVVNPIRLQAYERVVLLLERISPNSLLLRSVDNSLTPSQMRFKLIQSIRDEYEHNLSQQVYVSVEAWEMVRNAKEELVRIINTAYGQLGENATAHDLSSKVIELNVQSGNLPVENALTAVKKEIQKIF